MCGVRDDVRDEVGKLHEKPLPDFGDVEVRDVFRVLDAGTFNDVEDFFEVAELRQDETGDGVRTETVQRDGRAVVLNGFGAELQVGKGHGLSSGWL